MVTKQRWPLVSTPVTDSSTRCCVFKLQTVFSLVPAQHSACLHQSNGAVGNKLALLSNLLCPGLCWESQWDDVLGGTVALSGVCHFDLGMQCENIHWHKVVINVRPKTFTHSLHLKWDWDLCECLLLQTPFILLSLLKDLLWEICTWRNNSENSGSRFSKKPGSCGLQNSLVGNSKVLAGCWHLFVPVFWRVMQETIRCQDKACLPPVLKWLRQMRKLQSCPFEI